MRPLAGLLGAELVSHTGSQMTWVALPWFVLTTTGSPSRMGMVLVAELAPAVVFGIPGGALAARLGPRRTLLVADAARGPLLAAIPLLYALDLLSFPVLLVLVAATGVFFAPYFAAQRVVLPALLGDDERALARAGALMQAATRSALVLGPALAGVLLAHLDPPTVLYVDAATYVVAVVLVLAFVPSTPPAPREEHGRMLDGLRALRRDRFAGPVVLVTSAFEMAFQSLFALLPVLVVVRYGERPAVLGAMLAGMGAGALAGSGAAALLANRIGTARMAQIGGLGQVLPIWLLVVDLPPPYAVAALVLTGLCMPMVNASLMAMLTLRVPPALRQQVMTAAITVIMLAGPVGIAVAAPAAETFGLVPVLVVVTSLISTSALGLALVLRRQSARVAPPSTVTSEPVTYDAAGESTNAATLPNSSGSP